MSVSQQLARRPQRRARTASGASFNRYGEDGLDVFSNDAFRNYLFRSAVAAVADIALGDPTRPPDTLLALWGGLFSVEATLPDIQARFAKLLLKKVQLDAIPVKELTVIYTLLLRKEGGMNQGLATPNTRKRDYMLLELRCRYDEMLQKFVEGSGVRSPSRGANVSSPPRPRPPPREATPVVSGPSNSTGLGQPVGGEVVMVPFAVMVMEAYDAARTPVKRWW